MVVTSKKGDREIAKGKGVKYMVMKEVLSLDGGHMMQYASDVS